MTGKEWEEELHYRTFFFSFDILSQIGVQCQFHFGLFILLVVYIERNCWWFTNCANGTFSTDKLHRRQNCLLAIEVVTRISRLTLNSVVVDLVIVPASMAFHCRFRLRQLDSPCRADWCASPFVVYCKTIPAPPPSPCTNDRPTAKSLHLLALG